MSNTSTRKQTPPTNQAEYTAWRNAQKAAEAATKGAKPVTEPAPKAKSAPKAKQAPKAAPAAESQYESFRSRRSPSELKSEAHYTWCAEWRTALENLKWNLWCVTERRVLQAEQAERDRRDADRAARAEYERQAQAARRAEMADGPKAYAKAVKAGRLAVSAERIGSLAEAGQAARTAGRLGRRYGAPLADLFTWIPGIDSCPTVKRHMTEAWN